jgi:hypothetical protein
MRPPDIPPLRAAMAIVPPPLERKSLRPTRLSGSAGSTGISSGSGVMESPSTTEWVGLAANHNLRLMPDGPLVTVFTATKDIGAEIDTTYRSLLGQTYDRWEWVVVDDSERADTGERIEALAGAPASKGRIRLYRQFPP